LSKTTYSAGFSRVGIDAFYDHSLVVENFMTSGPVTKGSLKPDNPLPFHIDSSGVDSASYVKKMVFSQAIQDLTECIPIEFSSKSSSTGAFLTYVNERCVPIDKTEDGNGYAIIPHVYYAPFQVGVDGVFGDKHTNDSISVIPLDDLNSDPAENGFSHAKSEFFSAFKPGPWVNTSRPSVSGKLYDDLDKIKSPPDAEVWKAVHEHKSPVDIGSMKFIRMNYSPLQFEDFVKYQHDICILDFGSMEKIFAKGGKKLRRYEFLMPCGFTRHVLVIKKTLLVESSYYPTSTRNSSDLFTDHPYYIAIYPGCLKTFAIASSLTYAALLAQYYLKRGEALDSDDIVEASKYVFARHVTLPSGKSKPGKSMLTRLFLQLVDQQIRPGLCVPMQPKRFDSARARDALLYLNENATGYTVYADDDTPSDDDDSDPHVLNFVFGGFRNHDTLPNNSKEESDDVESSGENT
jgi:hypothetical protein